MKGMRIGFAGGVLLGFGLACTGGPGGRLDSGNVTGGSGAEAVTVQPTAVARLNEENATTPMPGQDLYVGSSAEWGNVGVVRYDASALQHAESAHLFLVAGQSGTSSYSHDQFNQTGKEMMFGLDVGVQVCATTTPWQQDTVTWQSYSQANGNDAYACERPVGKGVISVPYGETRGVRVDISDAIDMVQGQPTLDLVVMATPGSSMKGPLQRDTKLAGAPELVVEYQ